MLPCTYCSFECKDISALWKHLAAFHSLESFFKCMQCSRSYHSVNSLKKHYVRNHNFNQIYSPTILNSITNSTLSEQTENIELASVMPSPSFSSEHVDNCDVVIDSPLSPAKDIQNLSLNFIAKLHNYGDVPRSRVIEIVRDTSDFFHMYFDSIVSELESLNLMNEELKIELNKRKTPFKNLESEFLQMKAFSNRGSYIAPQQVLLGLRRERRKRKGKFSWVQLKTTAEFIPIHHVLKLFFELPGYYDEIFNYIDSLKGQTLIQNFMQSNFWINETRTFGNKLILPIFIYFDDFENNNVLGSHAGLGKCGAIYLLLPFLPDHLRSKLNNILLFVLFNSLDRKNYKNKVVFRRVIDELNFLRENGVHLYINGKALKVYFQLALILGDNLGLHSILGFAESFRTVHPCRFCLIHFNDLNKFFVEDNLVLRNEANYKEHLNNVKKPDFNSFNIVEECVFHELPYFHATRNVSVDVMHDVWEGVVPYDLAKILNFFINVEKTFSLDLLNQRILGFPYQDWENQPVEITQLHLKKRLKLSSAEAMTLLRNFGLLIGDLIPEDHECWGLFIQLKQVVDIIMDTKLLANSYKCLKVFISEYLSNLNEFFPSSIKPKHHHLVHYPTVLHQMGPLWHMSSMRGESRHREGKKISRNAICRANVCRTIAIKMQLQLNHRFLSRDPLPSIFSYGPIQEVSVHDLHLPSELKNSCSINDEGLVASMKWITRYSKKIHLGHFVIDYKNDSIDPCFFEIKYFVLDQVKGLLIFTKGINKFVYFDSHFQSFHITDFDSSEPSEWKLFSSCEIHHSTISPITRYNGKKYIIINKFC